MSPRPAEEVRLSLREKLHLVVFYAVVITKTAISAITWPISAPANRSRVFRRHVSNSLVRHVFSNSTSRIEQAICPDTDELYRIWAKQNNVTPAKEVLSDGTEAFWFGSKDAQTVLLFFHGGGYHLPALPGHIEFAARLVNDLNPTTPAGFAVLFLQYDAGPFGRYPRQLVQAASMFKHVQENLKIPNILLGGDSAGGNMTLGLLGHMLHPHPDPSVPRIDMSGGHHRKVKGAVLISPWIDPFGTHYASLRRNEPKDLLAESFLQRWSKAWVDGKPEDPYNRPNAAPEGWWTAVDTILERFVLVIGADEILLDGALEFAKVFKKEWQDEKDTTVAVQEDEGHISCVMDPANGIPAEEVRMYVQVRDSLKEFVSA